MSSYRFHVGTKYSLYSSFGNSTQIRGDDMKRDVKCDAGLMREKIENVSLNPSA